MQLKLNDGTEINIDELRALKVNKDQRIIMNLKNYEKLNQVQKTGLLNILNAFFAPARCILFPLNTEIKVIEVKMNEKENGKEIKIN